jgi:hypothetical protein
MALVPSSCKETPLTWWTPQIEQFSATRHHNTQLVKVCTSEKIRSKGRNRNIAIEELKTTTRLKK